MLARTKPNRDVPAQNPGMRKYKSGLLKEDIFTIKQQKK